MALRLLSSKNKGCKQAPGLSAPIFFCSYLTKKGFPLQSLRRRVAVFFIRYHTRQETVFNKALSALL